MQPKWLEDLLTLSRASAAGRAVKLTKVTQPAFGQRIQALPRWECTPRLGRVRTSIQPNTTGTLFCGIARQAMHTPQDSHRGRLDLLGFQEAAASYKLRRDRAWRLLGDMAEAVWPSAQRR